MYIFMIFKTVVLCAINKCVNFLQQIDNIIHFFMQNNMHFINAHNFDHKYTKIKCHRFL